MICHVKRLSGKIKQNQLCRDSVSLRSYFFLKKQKNNNKSNPGFSNQKTTARTINLLSKISVQASFFLSSYQRYFLIPLFFVSLPIGLARFTIQVSAKIVQQITEPEQSVCPSRKLLELLSVTAWPPSPFREPVEAGVYRPLQGKLVTQFGMPSPVSCHTCLLA